MKRHRVIVLLCLFAAFVIAAHAGSFFYPATVTVFFSPRGGCTDAIVNEINAATRSVQVQAYGFTSIPIAEALLDAYFIRGIDVAVVLDRSNRTARDSLAPVLADAGIPILIDDRHAIAHSKVMVIDGASVITGSFNFTRAAEERNVENLLIIRESPQLVSDYEANIAEHSQHSTPL